MRDEWLSLGVVEERTKNGFGTFAGRPLAPDMAQRMLPSRATHHLGFGLLACIPLTQIELKAVEMVLFFLVIFILFSHVTPDNVIDRVKRASRKAKRFVFVMFCLGR